jgi:hypothetical protein
LETISSEQYVLKGQVRANTYYYEEGNVQFNLKTDFQESLNEADEIQLVQDIINKIEESENNVKH